MWHQIYLKCWLWGVATIDGFASEKNQKPMRFNSKHVCPGTLGVDAFAFDWAGEFNWFLPPLYLIGTTIENFFSSTVQGGT